MVGCSALNCTNDTKKGFRLFVFPKDAERRKKWKINCRRDKWEPSDYIRLCEVFLCISIGVFLCSGTMVHTLQSKVLIVAYFCSLHIESGVQCINSEA